MYMKPPRAKNLMIGIKWMTTRKRHQKNKKDIGFPVPGSSRAWTKQKKVPKWRQDTEMNPVEKSWAGALPENNRHGWNKKTGNSSKSSLLPLWFFFFCFFLFRIKKQKKNYFEWNVSHPMKYLTGVSLCFTTLKVFFFVSTLEKQC